MDCFDVEIMSYLLYCFVYHKWDIPILKSTLQAVVDIFFLSVVDPEQFPCPSGSQEKETLKIIIHNLLRKTNSVMIIFI